MEGGDWELEMEPRGTLIGIENEGKRKRKRSRERERERD